MSLCIWHTIQPRVSTFKARCIFYKVRFYHPWSRDFLSANYRFSFFRPPDTPVSGLMFYHGFFFLLSFFFFRRLISELPERNSTKIGHMLGSNCDLKTHVQKLGYPSPTNREPKTTFLDDFATYSFLFWSPFCEFCTSIYFKIIWYLIWDKSRDPLTPLRRQ